MRNWKEKEKLKKWLERCISLHISMQLYGRNGLDHQGRHVLIGAQRPFNFANRRVRADHTPKKSTAQVIAKEPVLTMSAGSFSDSRLSHPLCAAGKISTSSAACRRHLPLARGRRSLGHSTGGFFQRLPVHHLFSASWKGTVGTTDADRPLCRIKTSARFSRSSSFFQEAGSVD